MVGGVPEPCLGGPYTRDGALRWGALHPPRFSGPLLPRNADIRASLPVRRTLTTYGPQASRTGAALRGPLGPTGVKNSGGFSFVLERVV